MKKIILFILISLVYFQSNAQEYVNEIIITGNTKTKDYVILREVSFKEKESYKKDVLDKKIKASQNNLINLKLFNFVEIKKINTGDVLKISITVVEKWYIWPYPILEISERNFNTWWQEFSESNYSDFSKLDYGVFLKWENFRGRNELLRLKIRKGFNEHYLLGYYMPYLNKKKTIGLNIKMDFFRRKETFYKTENNTLIYYKKNNLYTSKDYKATLDFIYRKGIHKKHTLKFNYFHSIIADSISILNPNYLQNNQNIGSFYKISYEFKNDHRDYIIYPLEGYLLSFSSSKYLPALSPINHLEFKTKAEKYIKASDHFYLGSSFFAKLSSEENQAYFIKERGFGFRDYVRGYEYYVVDGQHYWISRTAVRYALVEKFKFEIPYIKMSQFKKSHHSVYLGIFSDMGYIYDLPNAETNPLQKKLLWGKGISLDYLTYYDKLLRIEYSINHLGEKGVFLHFSNPFGHQKDKL